MSEYRLKIGAFSQQGQFDPTFQVVGIAPTNHSSSIKTRVNGLSYGIKIWTDLLRFVTNHAFDRRTDEQADRHLSRS